MADLKLPRHAGEKQLLVKFVDQGDGTFAERFDIGSVASAVAVSKDDDSILIYGATDQTGSQKRIVKTADDGTVLTQQAGFTLTDRSGSITVGGTAQQLAPDNPSRRYLLIQNVSSADLWVNFGTTNATLDSPSIKILPSQILTWEGAAPTDRVTIIGATTGQKFTAKEG